MSHSTLTAVDAPAAVGRFAVRLGRTGAADLPGALAELVAGAGLRSAVLRRAGTGELLAAAGDVVQAVSDQRTPGSRRSPDGVPVVELSISAPGDRLLATLRLTGALPHLLPSLRVAAAVLGLALALAVAPPGPAAPLAVELLAGELLAADLLAAAEADRDALADALHDSTLQDLVAARYAADAAVRGGDPRAVHLAVQQALVSLRRTVWQLRPRGAQGLEPALSALSGRVVEAGGQPLALSLQPGSDELAPAVATAAYRVVRAVAADGTPPVAVRAQRDGGVVLLTITGGVALPSRGSWDARLRALGGELISVPDQVRLVLPALPAPGHLTALPRAGRTKATP